LAALRFALGEFSVVAAIDGDPGSPGPPGLKLSSFGIVDVAANAVQAVGTPRILQAVRWCPSSRLVFTVLTLTVIVPWRML